MKKAVHDHVDDHSHDHVNGHVDDFGYAERIPQ
jgi:hypothetical protein